MWFKNIQISQFLEAISEALRESEESFVKLSFIACLSNLPSNIGRGSPCRQTYKNM